MVSFGDVPACSGKKLSHPLMSLCPMHINLENPGEFLEEWQVIFSLLDINWMLNFFLVGTPKGPKCGLKNLTLPIFNVAVPKAVPTRQVAV